MTSGKLVIKRSPALQRGLERAIAWAGSRTELARRLGISHPAVFQWEWVPISRVPEIERLTGIPREELRPDIYARQA